MSGWERSTKMPQTWPRGYSIWVHSQTQNKAQRLADCGHVSASSQSLRFILSLRMNSSSKILQTLDDCNSDHYVTIARQAWHSLLRNLVKYQQLVLLLLTANDLIWLQRLSIKSALFFRRLASRTSFDPYWADRIGHPILCHRFWMEFPGWNFQLIWYVCSLILIKRRTYMYTFV